MLRSAPVRVLHEADRAEVAALLAADPVVNCFVAARIEEGGLDPWRLGAEVWGFHQDGALRSLCYAGANLVPVAATREALAAFVDRARRQGRRCSSLVGEAAPVLALWEALRPDWGPARDVRARQPLMCTDAPSAVPADPLVRVVGRDQVGSLLPASVAMFTEEVGVSPIGGDGGALYRARVAELVEDGRALARFDGDRVVFKAEIGSVTAQACQIQGVWVDPVDRGKGLAAGGMAAVVEYALREVAPLVSLYVNDYNAPARAAYRRVGFREIGSFASILF